MNGKKEVLSSKTRKRLRIRNFWAFTSPCSASDLNSMDSCGERKTIRTTREMLLESHIALMELFGMGSQEPTRMA
jgi:hypothetical protein